MRGIGRGIVVLAATVLAVELGLRGCSPRVVDVANAWEGEGAVGTLRPGLDAWVSLGRTRTDGDGRRFCQATMEDPVWTVLVLGEAFTAGLGLDDDALYVARLAEWLEPQQVRVVGLALRGSDEARAARALQAIDEVQPDSVLVQVGPAVDSDHGLFWCGESEAVSEPPPSAVALREAWAVWRGRRELKRKEQAAREHLDRDGVSAMATQNGSARSRELMDAVRRKQLTEEHRTLLRAVLREDLGVVAASQREARRAALATLLQGAQDRGCRPAILRVGPPRFTLSARLEADARQIPRVQAPPYFLDGALRIGERPAAVVHELTAQALWATLAPRGFFGPRALDVPVEMDTVARSIAGVGRRHLAHEEELNRLARDLVPADLSLDSVADLVPVLHGFEGSGVWSTDAAAELVLWRGVAGRHLFLDLECPKDSVPTMWLRLGGNEEQVLEATSVTEQGGDLVRARYEWRNPPLTHPDTNVPIELKPSTRDGVRLLRATWVQSEGSDP